MAVYLDSPERDDKSGHECFRGRVCARLAADKELELRNYVSSIHLPMRWIQRAGKPDVHFYLTGQWLAFCQKDLMVQRVDSYEFERRLLIKQGRTPPPSRPAAVAGRLDFGADDGTAT